MRTYGPDTASCEVLVFREGLLSAVAHDLLLRVGRFEVRVDPSTLQVEATFDPSSIGVVTAMRNGRPLTGALSPADRRKIEAAIGDEVLAARRHPAIRFVSSAVTTRAAGFELVGRVELHGAIRPLTAAVRRDAERLVTEARIHQPEFGIRPYSALMGALRVKPDVIVRLSLPSAAGA